MEGKQTRGGANHRSMEQLREDAKRLNIEGAASMNRSELESAIKRHRQRHS